MLQLASLAPALAVFNFVNYFFFFLNAATTVQVTKALARNDRPAAESCLSDAVLIATVSGLVLAAVLIAFAPQLVAATGCVPALIPVAAKYLRVRALGQPVVLVSMVVQAGLLAQRDARTPLVVISVASLLNIVGDLLWVPRLGAVGAAWATLVSQLLALPLMLGLAALRKRLPVRLDRRPRLSELKAFLQMASPLFCFEMGLATCYALIQSLSTQFSVASAAAFQALWTPVSVLAFATYPLKQAATVFLPKMLSDGAQVGGEPKSREFLKVLASLSSGMGVTLAAVAVWLARTPALFTTDATLWPTITSFSPYVAAVLLVLGFAQVLEGVLLGTGDLDYLSWSQLGNVLSASACFAATKALGMGVHGTWLVFFVFLLSRATQASLRVFVFRKPWSLDDGELAAD